MDPTESTSFQDIVNEALAPELAMRLLKEDANVALYVGIWSVWGVNDEKTLARIVLATVAKDNTKVQAPSGPLPLNHLGWIILQFQTIDEESPSWTSITALMQAEFKQVGGGPTKGGLQLQFDPSTANMKSRQVVDAVRLSAIAVVHADTEPQAQPLSVLNRKRVPYVLPDMDGVTVFIEQQVTKHPLQQKLNGEFGLTKEGTLMAAINEWRTWLVVGN